MGAPPAAPDPEIGAVGTTVTATGKWAAATAPPGPAGHATSSAPPPPPAAAAPPPKNPPQPQQQQRPGVEQPSLVSARSVVVVALALAQVAAAVYLIYEVATNLRPKPVDGSRRQCLLGANPSDPSPCNYAIALGSIGLLGSCALLAAMLSKMATDALKAGAQRMANQVSGADTKLLFKLASLYKLLVGGWISKLISLALLIVGMIWWAVGLAVLIALARSAGKTVPAGASGRTTAVAAAAAGLAAQLAMLGVAIVSLLLKVVKSVEKLRRKRRGKKTAAPAAAVPPPPRTPVVGLVPATV